MDWPQIDWTALRSYRWEKVKAVMDENNLDHLLLMGFDNIRYATDYRTQIIAEATDWCAALVDSSGAVDIFVPWIDEVCAGPEPDLPWIRAVHPLPSWTPAAPHAPYWAKIITGVMGSARRIGVESGIFEIVEALKVTLPGVEFVEISTALYIAREEKHPLEVELLRAASIVNASAAEHALRHAQAGMTDYDVLALVMSYLQTHGVEFLSHSLCNHRRGTGTWFAAGSTLAEGDAFFFDVGCYGLGGYASDIARTGFIGEPNKEIQKAWGLLHEAYEIGQDMAKPGVKVSKVHNTVNEFLEKAGLPRTPYSMGHGVGLRACELPTIHRSDRMQNDEILQEGWVISLEPETAVEYKGQPMLLKIEDNFVVGRDSLEKLSVPSLLA
ncbi:MAG: M24 family metallopeptidase [Actinomycetota bacterium]